MSSGAEEAEAAEGAGEAPGAGKPPVRWRIVWGSGAVLVALGVAAGTAVALAGEDEHGLAAVPATVEVVRTTLVENERVDGELDYVPSATVTAVGGASTLTWLPEEGDVLSRGQTVYRADERPRVLLYGDTPFHRDLAVGHRGRDVRLLEENLTELGYTGFTADTHYTWATARAVRAWQRDLGLPRTGQVEPGDVLVAAGPARVGGVGADLGGTAGGTVLELTTTDRAVTADLEVSRRHLVAEGGPVSVELPDGRVLDAEVAEVDGSVSVPEDGDGLADATVRLVIALTEEAEAGMDEHLVAPVRVAVEIGRAQDVLAVPVEALVALREGGHGVQAVGGDGGTEYVAVETGLFADGLVEVSGDGITEGRRVGVPE